MLKLGTILPCAATLITADSHADKERKRLEAIGDKRLSSCSKRVVGGEVRWYDTTDQYAIVSRGGEILWFQVTPKGDFRIHQE